MPKRNDPVGNEDFEEDAMEDTGDNAENNPKAGVERDMDDLVHSLKEKGPAKENEEIDPDDAIHVRRPLKNSNPGNVQDPDDAIHR